MKKMLIHGEYMCILNLIALPFLIMFYNNGSFIFWALLIFLDVAELMLLVDEKKFFTCIMDPQYKAETQRIKLYLVAIVAVYLYIAIFQSFILLIIILINDGISSALDFGAHKYLFKSHEEDTKA